MKRSGYELVEWAKKYASEGTARRECRSEGTKWVSCTSQKRKSLLLKKTHKKFEFFSLKKGVQQSKFFYIRRKFLLLFLYSFAILLTHLFLHRHRVFSTGDPWVGQGMLAINWRLLHMKMVFKPD